MTDKFDKITEDYLKEMIQNQEEIVLFTDDCRRMGQNLQVLVSARKILGDEIEILKLVSVFAGNSHSEAQMVEMLQTLTTLKYMGFLNIVGTYLTFKPAFDTFMEDPDYELSTDNFEAMKTIYNTLNANMEELEQTDVYKRTRVMILEKLRAFEQQAHSALGPN